MSPIASSESDVSRSAAASRILQLRCHLPGFNKLLLQGARAVENVFDETGRYADRIAEPLRQVVHQAVGGFRRGRERVFGAPALLLGNLALLICNSSLLHGDAALPVSEPASASASTRPAARLPVRMLRRWLAPRRLSATNAWVCSVGAGAPCGRDAIQRSASSSAGERSNSPPGRPASDHWRAASPNSVCCLIQPMSVRSASASLSALTSNRVESSIK